MRSIGSRFSFPKPLSLLFAVALASLSLGSGCGGNQPDAPPPFQINIDSVTSANLNENYQISWSYTPENRLEDQFIEIQTLTISTHLRVFLGCPPEDFRPAGLPDPTDCGQVESSDCPNDGSTFTNNCRTLSRRFSGPVVVSITAKDSETQLWKRKSVILRIPNSHFRATVSDLTNVGVPRFGGATTKTIEFFKYFALYNDGRTDREIEGLATAPFSAIFQQGFPFFASSVTTNANFGFRTGRDFPGLDPSFLDTEVGRQFVGQQLQSDALVFAGGLSFSGEYEEIADTNRQPVIVVSEVAVLTEMDGVTSQGFNQEPIFMQVDLITDPNAPPIALRPMIPTNFRFGNINQGLVLPTFGAEDLPIQPSISQNSTITLRQSAVNAPVGLTNGNIPDCSVSIFLNSSPMSVAFLNVDWSNVPAYPDNNMSDLLSTPQL